MGSKRHDDRSSRMGNPDDPGSRAPGRGAPGRAFDRAEDMGGSGWSGASGRGGLSYEGSGYAASNRGYGGAGSYGGERPPGHEHGHEGGYPGDRRYSQEGSARPYPQDRRFGHEGGRSYGGADYGRGGGYGDAAGYGRRDDAGFIEERGFGHVPGQRWGGGYGGDRDESYRSSGPSSGRGFTGSDFSSQGASAGGRREYTPYERDLDDRDRYERERDERDRDRDRPRDVGSRADMGGRDFGGLPRLRDRQFGAPADMSREQRHFGTAVDRGGRMFPGGGGQGGRGTDMGMGAPEDQERGPHWGKGPKGYKRSDERTREEVCEAIAHQGHIDASDVEVKVEKGIVILTGTVAQRHHKRALEMLVEQVRGVHEVHNELRLAKNLPPRDEQAPHRQHTQAQDRGQEHANGLTDRNGKGVRA